MAMSPLVMTVPRGYLPKAISFMTEDMQTSATVKDQERAHCVTLACSIV